jgi:hypothetical protein
MIARIATLTPAGRPRITPLWFVTGGGAVHLTCRTESPAARDIAANGEVVVLFQADKLRGAGSVLKLQGTAVFHPGRQYSPGLLAKFALKYYLTPGGARSVVASVNTLPARLRYYRERAGEAGTIEFTPETAEIISST